MTSGHNKLTISHFQPQIIFNATVGARPARERPPRARSALYNLPGNARWEKRIGPAAEGATPVIAQAPKPPRASSLWRDRLNPAPKVQEASRLQTLRQKDRGAPHVPARHVLSDASKVMSQKNSPSLRDLENHGAFIERHIGPNDAEIADMLHVVAAKGSTGFASFERRLARQAGPDTPVPIERPS